MQRSTKKAGKIKNRLVISKLRSAFSLFFLVFPETLLDALVDQVDKVDQKPTGAEGVQVSFVSLLV